MGMKSALLNSALSRGVSAIAETMKGVAQDSVEDLARSMGRWARGTAILWGIGATLALVALTALSMGLAHLLATAGLPLYGAYLIVAAAAGVAGFLLFKSGATRRVRPRAKGEPEGSRVRIRIVARRAPRRRARRAWELEARTDSRPFRSRRRAPRGARGSRRVRIQVPDRRV
jgi:hypothetical protein